jgi:hypothetical protein
MVQVQAVLNCGCRVRRCRARAESCNVASEDNGESFEGSSRADFADEPKVHYW